MSAVLVAAMLLPAQALGVNDRAGRPEGKAPRAATASVGTGASDIVEGQWIVAFDRGVDDRAKGRVRAAGLAVGRVGRDGRQMLVTGDLTQTQAFARIADLEGIDFAEPVRRYRAALVPGDAGYPMQWGLPKVGAPTAWDSTTGTQSVTIAIIDTGVDLSHPEFTGRLDLVNDYDFVNRDSTADDDHDQGHGTHVAGIAAAGMNNGAGAVGMAPNSTILPVKVLGADGYGTTLDIADGIRLAADAGAEVINMSLEGAQSGSVQAAVEYALAKNVVIVAAAGNGSGKPVGYPAAYPGVVAVSAVDQSLALASFSNMGERVDIAAPGVLIYSTLKGSSYGYMSGTSMASPFVAGTAVLMRSVNPELGQEEVVRRLTLAADDIGTPGEDTRYGSGFLNAARAVSLASAEGSDDEVPGKMIAASPATGTLDAATDTDDVFAVSLVAGEGLEVTMTLDPADDFDLRLFGPGTTSVRSGTPLVSDTGAGAVRRVVYYAVTSGIYYLDARAQSGTGDYSIAYRILPNNPADNDVPGVRLPASPVTGTLARLADDDDVFRVTLQRGERLTATLTGAPDTDFDLYVYPQTASTVVSMNWAVASLSEGEVAETVGYTALVPGDYYLDANAYSGAGAYTLTWSITQVGVATDDDVPGTLLPGASFTRSLDYETDLNDVYWVDLDAGQTLTTGLSTTDALGQHDFDLHLYGPDAGHVAPPDVPLVSAKTRVSYTVADTESLTYTAPVAGRYYIAVRSYWGDGIYTMSWSRTAGPADGGIPGVIAESPVRRLLGVDGDVDDVFDVTLTAGQQLRASLAASGTADFDLHLYGPDATALTDDTVVASYWRGNPESLTFVAPVSGTYHLDARRTTGTGMYTLQYSTGDATVAPSLLSLESTQVPGSSTATLTGTLSTGSGPVSGALLAFETYSGGRWQYAGAASTAATGRASIAVSSSTARFRVRHAGDLLTAAASSQPLDLPDVTPPDVKVTGVANGGLYRTAITPAITITGATTWSYRLDGSAYEPGTPIAAEGTHTLRVEARDEAGNTKVVEIGFTIDSTPPGIVVGGVIDGAEYSTAVTPTVSVNGANATTITLDGISFDSGTRVVTEGAHTLRVEARDAAGNTATRIVSFSVHYPPLPASSVSVATTSVVLPYGDTWEMTGTLTAAGLPLAERQVELWAAGLTGVFFNTGRVTTTTAQGEYSFGVEPASAGFFAVRFGGDDSAAASPLSAWLRVTPAPLIGTPLAPGIVWRTKYFTVSGSIAPTHSAESTATRVYLYLKSGTSWLPKGSLPAAVSADGTSYSLKTYLSIAGSWKLTARHVADTAHADAWSADSAYITVKDVFLTNPVAPTTMSRTKYYRVYGTLSPRHVAGTSPVRIYRELKVGTRWVPKGYLTARVTDYGTASSQYARSIRLSAGKWRLYAYHPADTVHPAKRSPSYDYVTVK